ncbi:MAG: hypothetical protein ACI837_001064 [Crocinitomicaceae bacterium]
MYILLPFSKFIGTCRPKVLFFYDKQLRVNLNEQICRNRPIFDMKKLAYLSIAVLFAACTTESSDIVNPLDGPGADTTAVIVEDTPTIPEDRKFNDLANFVAGVPGDVESTLKALEEKSGWQTYKTSMDAMWTKTNEKLPTMRTWAETEMAPANEGGGTLFYPFSGPDFLHADAFFPEYENIVMIGLEPIGTYPDMLAKSEAGKDQVYLNGVRRSMHMILGKSFFRTIAMASDFNGEVDGTLPVLMQFMNRTGHKVLYHEVVGVTPDGKLTTEIDGMADSTYFGNRYYFQREGSDQVRTLTYFAVNLANDAYVSRGGLVAKGLKDRKDLVAYLNSMNMESTYLKSASYLMHRDESFSIIRNLILDQCDYVLQDDSGIPIKYFDGTKWDLTFYGNYKFPISLFATRHQPDLKEVYLGEGIKDLPFGIGYQFNKGVSNLMKATKK